MLVVYSSGSVQAQLQFFSHIEDGPVTKDVKPLFSAHYDTVKAGSKLEKSSYEKICSDLEQSASKVAFLTDNVKGKSILKPNRYVQSDTSYRYPYLIVVSARLLCTEDTPQSDPFSLIINVLGYRLDDSFETWKDNSYKKSNVSDPATIFQVTPKYSLLPPALSY